MMAAMQNFSSCPKLVSCKVAAIGWLLRALIARLKSCFSMQSTWFAIALVLVDRACACLLGSEGALSASADYSLMPAGSAGIYAAWAVGHCDSMDGPVITRAKQALASANVNLVLPWVRAEDEPEIRSAFENTLAVRKLGEQAERLADRYFFETLVRVHRAGEGAPYRGIKPAGQDMPPVILAADDALDDGSIDAVIQLLGEAMRKGIHDKFHAALSRRKFDPDNVAAGREYVEAYVSYIHLVEGLWHIASGGDHGHHAGQEAHEH